MADPKLNEQAAEQLPQDPQGSGQQQVHAQGTADAEGSSASEASGQQSAAPSHLAIAPDSDSIGFILDIPLRVSVELGRTRILVQDLLKLHKGSVLELNKLAGESLEVLVNERVVAKGEVIVINEKFGIRLVDIVSQAQRIRELGE